MYTHKYSDITLRYPFKGRNFESQCQIMIVMKQMVGHIATTTIIGLFTHMCTYVQDTAFVWPPFVSTVSRNWRCVWAWYMCVFYFYLGSTWLYERAMINWTSINDMSLLPGNDNFNNNNAFKYGIINHRCQLAVGHGLLIRSMVLLI